MEVRSLGYRTDLAILALEGSQVTDHGDHLVVRTPSNPDYWWGNFLLLEDLGPGSGSVWMARFAAEFPGAQHMALGLDETDAGTIGPDELAGMTMEQNAVMTATSVHAPPSARLTAIRALTEAGHGTWFGAFLDDTLVSQLGLITGIAGRRCLRHARIFPGENYPAVASHLPLCLSHE